MHVAAASSIAIATVSLNSATHASQAHAKPYLQKTSGEGWQEISIAWSDVNMSAASGRVRLLDSMEIITIPTYSNFSQ